MINKARRNYLFYLIMLMIFGMLMFWVIQKGSLHHPQVVPDTVAGTESVSITGHFDQSIRSNFGHPLSLLLLQVIAILIFVRIFSYLFKYIGQPGVIGEITAGIILGPSVLGYFFPGMFHFLFAPESLVPLGVISQIGLILFMFVVGMELDLGIIRKKSSETLVISHTSIFFPFLLGLVLAYVTYPEFGAPQTAFLPYALFIAISISITALPVLARIIQERNLAKTKTGMLAIACAANNDVTAWCMLAAIIAVVNAGSVASAAFTIGFLVVYVLIMFFVVRPVLHKFGSIYNNQEVLNKTYIAFIFLILIISSYATEILGIHALFGAFMAGIIMPENISFRRIISEKVEDVALVLFLPLFFVFTGLRTELGLLNTPWLWVICGVFIMVSIVGKVAGATFSARFAGESWKDSLSIGVLMNTRGLMELIVLNIGYEMGAIPSPIFVILVIMAIFTTFTTTPGLVLVDKLFRKAEAKERVERGYGRILISFANPPNGLIFLNLMHLISGQNLKRMELTLVHYTIGTDTSPIHADEYALQSFSSLRRRAQELGLEIETVYRVTDHYIRDLTELAREGNYDFVLAGGGPNFITDYVRPVDYGGSLNTKLKRAGHLLLGQRWFRRGGGFMKSKTKTLFNSLDCAMGVFVNNHFDEMSTTDIGVLVSDTENGNLMRMVESSGTKANVEIMSTTSNPSSGFQRQMAEVLMHDEPRIQASAPETSLCAFVQEKQLIVISYDNWLDLAENNPGLIFQLPSFIVIKPKGKIS